MPSIEQSVAAWRQALDSMLTLGDQLTMAQWAAPTGCPKWSVGDIFAHLIGGEEWMSGRGPVPTDPEPVLARRGQPAADVLDELRWVYARRLAELDRPPPTEPPYPRLGAAVPAELQWALRAFDVWVHEQDVRWAVGAPTTLATLGARIARDLFLAALPKSIAQVAPPGTSVRLIVIGELPVEATVIVDDNGRGHLSSPVDQPTSQITLRWESYVRLCCGRTTAATEPAWTGGDPALALQLLENLRMTP